jgi:hypothetical protein
MNNNILSQINNVKLPSGNNGIVINNIAIQQIKGFDYNEALDEAIRVGMSLFRDRIYRAAVARMDTKAEAAELLGVSLTTIYKALERRKRNEKVFIDGTYLNNGNGGDGVG